MFASESVSIAIQNTTSGNVTIYWGDGSNDTFTGSTSGTSKSHTYSLPGTFFIAIVTTAFYNLGYASGVMYYNFCGANLQNTTSSYTYFKGSNDSRFKSILLCSNGNGDIDYAFMNNRLKFVSWPSNTTSGYSSKQFLQCISLITINAKFMHTSNYQFCHTANLERVQINGSVASNTFRYCDSLREVVFGSGAISDANMNSKWAMLMTTTTPPNVAATSPTWGTFPIYVPDSAVDTYKAANKWSDVADYILPASQYPDK